LVLVGGIAPAQAQEEPEAAVCLKAPTTPGCRIVRVEAVLVDGLISTERHVIDRELRFEEGEVTSIARIEESMVRLRNTGLFREVTYQLIARPIKSLDGDEPPAATRAPARIVRIIVDERWTLLPAFRFAQGGDLTTFSVGLYDINVAGKFMELGVQYDRLGTTEAFWTGGGAANSFVAWWRKPRFLDSYWWVSADVWSAKRLRTLYADGAQVEGGFLLDRLLVRARAEYELEREFWAGLAFDYMDDDFSDRFVVADRSAAQRANFGGLPQGGSASRISAITRLGRVNQDDYRYDGWRVSGVMSHSDPLWGADFRFTQLGVETLFYKMLPWRGNVAARLSVDVGDAEQVQHLYYIGGLSEVRGYADSRFRGSNAWVGNLEYRVAPLATQWIVLQGVVFVDGGGVAGDATKLPTTLSALSTGVGLRIISPKIYRFVIRADYAVPWVATDGTYGFSFGAQQFF
jgi:hypothetical protein